MRMVVVTMVMMVMTLTTDSRRKLEKDVMDETSGHFKRLLVSQVTIPCFCITILVNVIHYYYCLVIFLLF